MKIYFRMFCGAMIKSYNTINTAFVDTAFIGSGGDMLVLSNISNVSNKLQITFGPSGTQFLKVGDKVVLSNISGDSVIGTSEGIPLVVTTVTTTTAILNLPITGTPTFVAGMTISQLHLYTSSSGMDSQFKQFSVYFI